VENKIVGSLIRYLVYQKFGVGRISKVLSLVGSMPYFVLIVKLF